MPKFKTGDYVEHKTGICFPIPKVGERTYKKPRGRVICAVDLDEPGSDRCEVFFEFQNPWEIVGFKVHNEDLELIEES